MAAKRYMLVWGVIFFLIIFFILFMVFWKKPVYLHLARITSFEHCAQFYPVLETYPRQCKTPDGKMFTETPQLEIEQDFIELKKGLYNQIIQRQQRIIRTSEGWASLWTEIFPTEMIASAVDFRKDMVLAVFMGQQNSGGYSIEIRKIIEISSSLEVRVKEVSPGPNCITSQEITQPYHIIQLKRSDKKINFVFEQEFHMCR